MIASERYHMLRQVSSILFFLLLILTTGCIRKAEKVFCIGVSLDKNDQWRQKMQEELRREALQYPDLRLIFCQSNGNLLLQEHQIDSLAASGADLIIVSTDAPSIIQDATDRVFDMGIPVITSSRGNSEKYTALVATDNYEVGVKLAECLVGYASENGYTERHPLEVIEICGKDEDTSPRQRHAGLTETLEQSRFVRLNGWAAGDWEEELALHVTDSLMLIYPNTKAIVAHNDIMAHAAWKASKARNPENSLYILGVDAIADGGEGLASIISGEINASVSNVTRGDLMIQTAYAILKHQPYVRDYYVPLEIVDQSSNQLMMRMAKELVLERRTMQTVESRTNQIGQQALWLKGVIIILGICLLLAVCVLVIVLLYNSHTQRRMMENNRRSMIEHQQKQLDDIYAELAKVKISQDSSTDFVDKLKDIIVMHIADPNFNVDQLSRELGVSRAQLFRKVKAQIGTTPVELIRTLRLQKARQLLQTTNLSVQQIAEAVGIQSTSYFTNSYKTMFGLLPKQEKRPE